MSNEVEFNSLTKDDVKITFEEPSRIPSKPTDEEVTQHKKTRLALVVVFAVIVILMVVVAVIIIIVAPKCAKKEEVPDETTMDDSWWKQAVIYQVYPRSFKDSNGDGNGDLKGITSKLDYISELGAQAVWLNPIYKSPMVDNGYDISDYKAIDEMFGTMEDFENFVKEAHKKGIKIIMGFVPNHTSKNHTWFVESQKSKDNKFRDYYIWRDGSGAAKDQPPNNWISVFGGSAWTYDNTTEQYYLHQFYKEQPDLNLTNENVKKELKDVLKFWLAKGVDGFRFDAVQFLIEDDKFDNEPQNSNYNTSDLKYDMLKHTYTNDLDASRELVKKFQEVLNEHNGSRPVLIAEVEGPYERTSKYYEVSDIPFNFGLITKLNEPGLTLAQNINKTVLEYIASIPNGKTPNWVIGNHDHKRVGSRVGKDNRHAMNALVLTLPGVVTTYYGEEIGMLNGNIANLSDPRDNARTPMQWNKEANAGFSTAKPWLEVGSDYLTINVETEKADKDSYYSKYKELVELRRNETAFVDGKLKDVHSDHLGVFSYIRSHENRHFLVIINFGDQIWKGDLEKISGRGIVLFDSDSESKMVGQEVDVNKINLNVGQAVILKKGDNEWHIQ